LSLAVNATVAGVSVQTGRCDSDGRGRARCPDHRLFLLPSSAGTRSCHLREPPPAPVERRRQASPRGSRLTQASRRVTEISWVPPRPPAVPVRANGASPSQTQTVTRLICAASVPPQGPRARKRVRRGLACDRGGTLSFSLLPLTPLREAGDAVSLAEFFPSAHGAASSPPLTTSRRSKISSRVARISPKLPVSTSSTVPSTSSPSTPEGWPIGLG
jgi:hypothetical protein